MVKENWLATCTGILRGHTTEFSCKKLGLFHRRFPNRAQKPVEFICDCSIVFSKTFNIRRLFRNARPDCFPDISNIVRVLFYLFFYELPLRESNFPFDFKSVILVGFSISCVRLKVLQKYH